jgi:AmmeMemoRadiSam system protein B
VRLMGDQPMASLVRPPAVAGAFYPEAPAMLETMVGDLLAAARAQSVGAPPGAGRPSPLGLMVPHAGLLYSGVAAAAGWLLLSDAQPAPTVVLLGTNHSAGWLQGVGAWETGTWQLPTGEVSVDEELASSIVALGAPFVVDREAHLLEHSIEVQLPLLLTVVRRARFVPLAVSAGRARVALDAGQRLGALLARRSAAGSPLLLAISTDMAHYPPATACQQVTDALAPAIVALDPVALAAREAEVSRRGIEGLVCGMCGIEPAVLGLAALREMGARAGTVLASATSADAGGSRGRTVGYLAARFD